VVRETHQEFGGRVVQGDGGGTFTNHASHVAGTIGASGVVAAAKGMATQVGIRSYTAANDTSEMTNDANLMVASNHSYGYLNGWFVDAASSWGLSTPSGLVDVWWSDYSTSSVEAVGFGKYDSNAVELDQVLADSPDLLSVWSAGNDRNDVFTNASTSNTYITYFSDPTVLGTVGAAWYYVSNSAPTPAPLGDGNGGTGYDTLSQRQNAKNSLVVGAVEDITADPINPASILATSFSSYGPTDDGRIKPDVVGNGANLYSAFGGSDTAYGTTSGTSMSAPNVTGTAALLIEHYNNEVGASPLAATSKGLLIHTAIDGGNVGPDYSYGWGLVDAAAAADFISSAATPGGSDYLAELSYTGSLQTFEVVSDGSGPLKATIVWTDPAGTAHPSNVLDVTTSVLVRDLDLQITGPGGPHHPWNLDPSNPAAPAFRTGPNHRDNVEQVLIDAPAAGVYTVRVSHTGTVASQNYTLLLSGGSFGTTDVSLSGGALLIDDTNGADTDDTITISLVGAGSTVRIHDPNNTLRATSGTTQIDANTVHVPYASVTSITFQAWGGDDTLTVDFSGGDPIPAGGLTFHGGTGDDGLVIAGNAVPFTDQVFTFTGKDLQGTGTGFDGTVDLDGSTITFTGLEPIDGGDAVNTTFNLPDVPGNPNNDIILRNHTTAGRIEIFDNTGSDFENTNVPNPTNSLTVNLGDQGDTITLLDLDDNFAPGAAINAFVINGGSGADTFHIQSTRQADGGTYSGLVIDAGGGDDVINIGSAGNSLDFILSPVTVSGDGHVAGDVLNISDQGTSTAGLVYNLTNSTVQRTGTAPVTYGTIESLVLNAGSDAAGDQINVQSTAAATPVTVNAGPGDDQINIGSPGNSLDDILGVVTVNGGAGDADALNINDENNPNARLYELTSSNVAWGPTAGPAA
jgi:hypothetical protein